MHSSSQKSRSQPAEKIILYCIAAIICLAPLPFGSDRPAPFAVITFAVGALSIFWGLFASRNKAFVRISLSHLKFGAAIMALVMLWAIIQIIPFNIKGFSSDFWFAVQQLLPQENIRSSVSINRAGAWPGFFRILSYIILFWLVLQTCRSSNNARKLLSVISLSGCGYAIYGLILKALRIQKILWYDKIYYVDSLTSTFVNRNNYATYAGIVLVVSIALFLNKLFENSADLKKRGSSNAILRRMFTTALPQLAVVLVIAASLILSASRAGIISSIIGVLALALLSAFTGSLKKYRKILLGLCAFIIILFGVIFSSGGEITISRFNDVISDSSSRLAIYDATINAIADQPLKGTGLGGFINIFPVYMADNDLGRVDTITTYAHNSYLELALELGLPAAMLLGYVLMRLWANCVYGTVSRRKNNYIPSAAASAVIVVAFHALFDFSAQIPAIAILFFALLAIGLAQSWSKQLDLSDASYEMHVPQLYHRLATSLAVLLGAILIMAGSWQFYAYFNELTAKSYRDEAISKIEFARTYDANSPEEQTVLKSAEQDLINYIKINPVDSYSWAYFSYIKFLLKDNEAATKFLVNSIANGIYDQRLIFFRIRLVPFLWENATDEERHMLENQVKIAWRMDSKKTLKTFEKEPGRELLRKVLSKTPNAGNNLQELENLEKQQ